MSDPNDPTPPPPPPSPSGGPVPRREALPLPEVIFHEPTGSTGAATTRSVASSSTALQASHSSLSRSVVPGPAPAVDSVIHRCIASVALTGLGVLVAWYGSGLDGRLDDGERWTVYAAVALFVLALGCLIAALVAVGTTVRQVNQNKPHRFGIARVTIAVVAAAVALVGAAVIVPPQVRDARDVVDAQAKASGPQKVPTVKDVAWKGLPTSLVTHLAVGACLEWPLGPTKSDRLSEQPDLSTIHVVPCSSPHSYEVVAHTDLPKSGSGYPSFAYRRATLDPICHLNLLNYLTKPGAEPVRESRWDSFGIAPSATDWAGGYRTGICVAIPPVAGELVNGSLKATG